MTHDLSAPSLKHLRGTDSNSLLRLYDLANETRRTAPSQLERDRAEKTIERLVRELQKRDIPLTAGPN